MVVNRLLSAVEAERLLGIPAGRVRQWKHRGVLMEMGLDRYRRPLYRESDLLALRDRTRTRDQHERDRRRGRQS